MEPQLSSHLSERVRPPALRAAAAAGGYVLYWMRTAARAHENPALDAAVELGATLGKPVFVYHALSERYPFASDRHHTFILEGARDVAQEIRRRGVGYAFHLERPGHRGPHLLELGKKAACVVTEDMPVAPLVDWTRRLEGALAEAGVPLFSLDTACVVPMALTKKAPGRAFAFRKATESLRLARLTRPWVDAQIDEAAGPIPALPFEPVDIADASDDDIARLVAECDIDHAVGPVPHTRGGSRAGYARWRRFIDKGLHLYDRTRNDPLRNGVSRMSAYLHYGMVSPLRLAREAATLRSRGAEKYLDELLVWRELAYHFCYHTPNHGDYQALPEWARETLEAHAEDAREMDDASWETLARGQTGDLLWDACQRSLLAHGELHNNVRMTWGKMIVQWADSPRRAHELLIDLNHRYALDGRDPASYGGLLWCMGLFDRPFTPERPVLGTVRPRHTAGHEGRLDIRRYAHRVSMPPRDNPLRVGVIGAGVAGSICARTLVDHGYEVVLFDKGRGPGGRASTRRGDMNLRYDHGAPYFSVSDPRFRRYVDAWIEQGVCAPWAPRVRRLEDGSGVDEPGHGDRARCIVAQPGMNDLIRHLIRDVDVRFGQRVVEARWEAGRHVLVVEGRDEDRSSEHRFDALVVAVPAEQAKVFLPDDLATVLDGVVMRPRLTALLALDREILPNVDILELHSGPVERAIANGRKPGRQGETWVLHATEAYSHAHIDDPHDSIGEALTGAFLAAVPGEPRPGLLLPPVGMRWRLSEVVEPLGVTCLAGPGQRVVAVGDYCLGRGIEGAFLSGIAAAGRILGWPGAEARQPSLFEGASEERDAVG